MSGAIPCGCDPDFVNPNTKTIGYVCAWHLEKSNQDSQAPFVWDSKVPYVQELTRLTNPHSEKVAPMPTGQETRITDPVTGGQKGSKLCQIGALDPLALIEVGKVAGFGGDKYERYNFAKGYKWSLSYDAMQRHLMAFWGGEIKDPESGLHHCAHAAWHCLALLTFSLRNKGTDDRFPV